MENPLTGTLTIFSTQSSISCHILLLCILSSASLPRRMSGARRQSYQYRSHSHRIIYRPPCLLTYAIIILRNVILTKTYIKRTLQVYLYYRIFFYSSMCMSSSVTPENSFISLFLRLYWKGTSKYLTFATIALYYRYHIIIIIHPSLTVLISNMHTFTFFQNSKAVL